MVRLVRFRCWEWLRSGGMGLRRDQSMLKDMVRSQYRENLRFGNE